MTVDVGKGRARSLADGGSMPLLGLGDRIAARGTELRRYEHLVARDPALAQSLPDAFLVAVCLGRVDVSIPELERPADGVHALGAVRDLPHAEAEQRDRVAVRECARPPLSHLGLR